MYDESGQVATYGIYRDITDRKKMEEALREREQLYHAMSITDGLTSLYNSRYFYEQINAETVRTNRYHHPLAMLMFDIDNFKNYNDAYGHLEGDYVLSKVGGAIREAIRETDSAYRYGGEEFAVILPNTDEAQAVGVAERIRETIREIPFYPRAGRAVTVTVSIGVTQYRHDEEVMEFVKRADLNLYTGKRNGKDRIISCSHRKYFADQQVLFPFN